MAQDTTPAIIVYRGNGDNSVPYDVPFDKGYYGEVKVLFVRRGLADYTYNPTTYTVNGRLYAWFSGTGYVYTHTPNPAVGAEIYNNFDEDTGNTVSAISGQTITDGVTTYTRAVQHDIANQLLLTWTGTVLTSDDFICIARETERGQPYEYPNNQKHIETALDNLERQIQEVANKADNALLVDPAHSVDSTKMNPIDWLKSIIRCIDFSVRAVRYANGWLDYSLDDPNIADGDKTWVHLLNTDNIKAIRERSEIVDNETVYWTEYQASDGTWRTLANTSEWDRKIQYAVDTADDAKSVADDAKDIAQDTKDIVEAFDDRLTQAEQDASDAKQDAGDAKDIAQDASDAVSAHITDTNNPHSVTATQVGALPNTTKYGAALSLTINSTTYVVTAQLKDQDGNNLGTAQTIDLPLESVVVSGAYDSVTKEVVLTLQDGSKIRFSVADLVSGLQTEITALNMLSADLVDDTNTTHKFVTTTEKTTWSGKQDAISDLATIRSGAAAGATAVQPGDNVSDLANDAGYLVMGDLTNFVTKNTAQTISGLKTFSADIVLSGTTSIKNTTSGVSYTMLYRDTSGIHVGTSTQALLLAGSGTRPTFNGNNVAMSADIPTVNNPTITITQGGVTKGSFTLNQATGDTIALDAGGGGSIDAIDNLTITKNGDDEIQAVATVNANTAVGATNPIYDWVGTLAEYNAQDIENTHPDWMCYITDDVSGGTSVYTKTEVDNNFVGKGHEVIAFQAPTAANNYMWYRKYADGWVEQGGIQNGNVNIAPGTEANLGTITLPIQMANSSYCALATGDGYTTLMNMNLTRSSCIFIFGAYGSTTRILTHVCWQVSGMAA